MLWNKIRVVSGRISSNPNYEKTTQKAASVFDLPVPNPYQYQLVFLNKWGTVYYLFTYPSINKQKN